MKIKIKNKNNTKKIIIISTILVVIVAGCGLFYYFNFHKPVAESARNSDEKEIGKKSESDEEAEKMLSENPTEQKANVTNSDKPNVPVKDEADNKYTVDINLSIGKNLSGKALDANAAIGAIVESGTCTYHFTNTNGQKIVKTAELLPSPTTTVCSSIDLTTGEFISGDWTVYADFSNDNYKGGSDGQSFSL